MELNSEYLNLKLINDDNLNQKTRNISLRTVLFLRNYDDYSCYKAKGKNIFKILMFNKKILFY